jgi:hypothetical protein
MQVLSRSSVAQGPENLVRGLFALLKRHILWDSLLLFVPPAAAVIYLLALLFQTGRLDQSAVVLAAIITLALGVAAVLLRRRPHAPTVHGAARLVDQKTGAKDHFLTLATLDPTAPPSPLLARLRLQAEGYLNRVELRRDFPYKFKRSSYWSIGVSLIAIVLMYLFLPVVPHARYAANVPERLRELAQQMAAKPELRGLSKELEALAAKLDDPKISPEDKQSLAQDMEQKLEEQQKKEEQKENRDLVGEAASALDGMEKQQQVASGQSQQKDQQKGGGIQSNDPQDGQGENKQSQSGAGDSKSDSIAQSQEQMDQGKSAKANPKEPGSEKNREGDTKNNQDQPDPNQPGKDPNKEKASKTEGGSKEGSGKQRTSEEPPPQGGPQADRFYKPGEGKEGLAAKGYVTVQMPEELIADAKGESRKTKDSKNGRGRSQVPVSNAPLPAHVPDAPMEKQRVPIEYRGIIR